MGRTMPLLTAVFICALAYLSSFTTPVVGKQMIQSVNGGTNCATCTVIIALLEQMSEFHNESIVKSMERLCSYIPDPAKYQKFCKEFMDAVGPLIIQLIAVDAHPDSICHSMGFCFTEPGRQTCHTFNAPPINFHENVKLGQEIVSHYKKFRLHFQIKICDIPGIKEICQVIENAFERHTPSDDSDQDFFSTIPTLRGTSWRGKDCDDLDPNKHPGALPIDDDRIYDSNCNGIYGTNPQTLVPYEKELCEGTQPRGIAVLGDSISAHFHLPENWFDATTISEAAFKHLDFILLNEIDWPEMSSTTGLGVNNWTEVIQGPIDSSYLRLRNVNRCNHRDYQNIAVNGARSGSINDNIMESLARNQETDRPMVVYYALVGNDVCNGHVDDTFAHMTTPEEMRTNVLKTLQFLDTKLPRNSTVILVGLADGRVLYNSLKDRIHPIGHYWNKFTYAQFYDYFNCLQVSPCAGWMNTNETVRNMTTARAVELTAVLQDVASQGQRAYKHFDLYFLNNPINKAISIWEGQGGQAWQLLEPVDGFHSNQYGQALTTQVVWADTLKLVPNVFGPVNQNNFLIQQIFGDQGGY